MTSDTSTEKTRNYIGLMSGTSMDGVDGVIAKFSQTAPKITVLRATHTPYPAQLQQKLREIIAPQWEGSLKTLLEVDSQIGHTFADLALQLMNDFQAGEIAAIGSHGQTVFHLPKGTWRNTWQLGDPNIIVERTGVTTIADWRRRDIAAGGQGAPLAPAFHAFAFRQNHDTAVLNLGGIANITLIPGDPDATIQGFDTGPANTLIDSWILQHQNQDFDKNGEWARSGHVDLALLQSMLSDPYFSKPPPKSTGREYFNIDWIRQRINAHQKPISAVDIQATLLELTCISVSNALRQYAAGIGNLYLCGGGAYNEQLIRRLRTALPDVTIETTAALGLDPEVIEATAFAWLAKQTLEGKTGNIKAVTGASGERILGAIYPK